MCSPVNAINIISNYAPFVRKLPLEVNKKFRKECQIIDRESKKLVEERCKEAENGELKKTDLLSIIINTNKTLPIEEKISKDELKYQVIKKRLLINYLSVYLLNILLFCKYFRLKHF